LRPASFWPSTGRGHHLMVSDSRHQADDAIEERGVSAAQDRYAAPEVRRCPELAHDDAAMAQDVFRRDHARDRHRRGPRKSAEMWSCDLHASDLPPALLLSVERPRYYRG